MDRAPHRITSLSRPALQKEKETSGVPDLPGGGSKLVELELYSIADRKLRGSLRDAGYIESQVTALQVWLQAGAAACGRGAGD
jgi:hypothetical protein